MKKSQLKLFLKKIVTEAKLLENIQDPSKDEMFNYLRQMYGNEEGFRDDAEVAIYWFANFYHGGQSSNLYSALSTSRFSPGQMAKGPEPRSSEEMMYEDLVLKYAPGTEEANKIQHKHNSLNENDSNVDKNAERVAKNQRIITKWMAELHDPRKVAVKMVDMMISRKLGGMTSADLADTSIFADGLDQIEDLLKDGKFEEALANAVETAKEMIADEAGEELQEQEDTQVNLDDNRWRGGVPPQGQTVLVKSFKGPNRIGDQIILKLRYDGGSQWSTLSDAANRSFSWKGKITHWMPLSKSNLKQEGDEGDAVNDMWAGSDDEMNQYKKPNPQSKQKSKTFFSKKPKAKTVQDFDWNRIKQGIDRGTLK